MIQVSLHITRTSTREFVFLYRDPSTELTVIRYVLPLRVLWGTPPGGGEPCWLLEGEDLDRKGLETYRMSGISTVLANPGNPV